jgi:hypothetical protein
MLVWLTGQNVILGLKHVFAFLVAVSVIFVHSQFLYVVVYSLLSDVVALLL